MNLDLATLVSLGIGSTALLISITNLIWNFVSQRPSLGLFWMEAPRLWRMNWDHGFVSGISTPIRSDVYGLAVLALRITNTSPRRPNAVCEVAVHMGGRDFRLLEPNEYRWHLRQMRTPLAEERCWPERPNLHLPPGRPEQGLLVLRTEGDPGEALPVRIRVTDALGRVYEIRSLIRSSSTNVQVETEEAEA